ncbi:hypothetical protein [Polaribacter atrinae]|uniref:Uncharacterized protein n=1 Tax=Polaribacter atrinae TaxID=1333662 RepID=A0A176TCH2_9FLAO|nr:hypothetical protein [Polaribacter atrinae]OAD45459.1 hypothetical protein LPB303_06830 [Polaribacter atrinae]
MNSLNLLPFFPFFDRVITAYDLLIFALGSLVLISCLLFYYQKIPKSNTKKEILDNPIYPSNDILLQSNSTNVYFKIAERKTSTFVTILAGILILLVVFTPFQDFLRL